MTFIRLLSTRPNIPVTPGLTHAQMQTVAGALFIACWVGLILMFIGLEVYKIMRVRYLKHSFEAKYRVQVSYRDIIRTWWHENATVTLDNGQRLQWNSLSDSIRLY